MKKTLKILAVLVMALCLVMAITGCAMAADGAAANPITTGLVELALDIVATIAMAAIGVVGAWLAAKLGQNKKLANIAQATNQVILAAQLTVGELQQTAVEAMKAAAPNGKLTKAQIAALNAQLLAKTTEKLSAPTVALLEAAKTDVNALIQGAAEDMINQMHAPAEGTATA